MMTPPPKHFSNLFLLFLFSMVSEIYHNYDREMEYPNIPKCTILGP